MNKTKAGFTLIELLVVILIIGLLSAVALPQYQKAVLKNRFSSLLLLGKTLNNSEEAYYLQQGTYASSLTDLDVLVPNDSSQITLGNEEKYKYVKLTRDDIHNNLIIYQKHSTNFAGETHCEAKQNNELANWLCAEAFQGQAINRSITEGYNTYVLLGDGNGNFFKTYKNTKNLVLEAGDTCIADQYEDGGCGNIKASGNGAQCKIIARGDGRGGNYACSDSTFTNGAQCVDDATPRHILGCFRSRFTNGGTCVGAAGLGSSCLGINLNNGHCLGIAEGSCSSYGWGGKFSNASTCTGNAKSTCTNSYFEQGSTCYANVAGACIGSTYDTSSYCDGKFCPDGAASSTQGKQWHREDDWDDETESILVDIQENE